MLCALLAGGALVAMRTCSRGDVEDAAAEEPAIYETGANTGLARSTELELSPLPLEEEAAKRLEGYRSEGTCTLECAGYLDLYGNAWGCLVQGDGWVEILVIRDAAEGSCSVQTIRLEATP